MGEAEEQGVFDRQYCLRLLAGQAIGRVVFTQAAMPTAELVSYLLDGDEVIFRAGDRLNAACRDAVVAFEVDYIDPETRTGWSVVGVGQAHELSDPVRLAHLTHDLGESSLTDGDAHTVAISVRIFTGRYLTAPNTGRQSTPEPVSSWSVQHGGTSPWSADSPSPQPSAPLRSPRSSPAPPPPQRVPHA